MGFWDKLGEIAGESLKSSVDEMKKKRARIERYKERYDSYDDHSLIEKYKSSSGEEKIACGMLLKERGYGD